LEKTYTIKAQCICCGRKATIVGYEKSKPNSILREYIIKGGRCPKCNSISFEITK